MAAKRVCLACIAGMVILSLLSGCVENPAEPSEEPPAESFEELSVEPSEESSEELSDEPYVYKIQSPVPAPQGQREQFRISIVDSEGQPVTDAEVSLSPLGVGFMVGTNANPPEMARDLLTNTRCYALYADWQNIENKDGTFNLDWLDPADDMNQTYLSIEAGMLWQGDPDDKTDDTRYEDLDDKKQEYLEYLSAVASYISGLQDTVAVYIFAPVIDDSPESNSLEWLAQEIMAVKQAHPDALVGPSLSHDGEPHVTDWDSWVIEEMIRQDIPFDIIGMEYHPGSYSPPDIEAMSEYYDELGRYGKPIHIWETYVPSGPSSFHPAHAEYLPQGGYTEENQAELLSGAVRVAIENPMVVGFCFLNWEDQPRGDTDGDGIPDEVYYQGLVRQDGTPKPSYYAVKDCLYEAFTPEPQVTDSEGRVVFDAFQGDYDLTVNANGEATTSKVILREQAEITIEIP